MTRIEILISGLPPRALGPEAAMVTVGRSLQNDMVVEDSSLSRHHARFEFSEGRVTLEDLGSRNGTQVNGLEITRKCAVKPGDEILLGTVPVTLKELPQKGAASAAKAGPAVLIDRSGPGNLANATLRMSAAMLRSGLGQPANDWTQALAFIQELTLGLIRDVTPEQLLEDLMDRLFGFLDADRGVVLLRNAQGEVEPVVVRTREGAAAKGKIRLSHTVVEAALQRREALLINDPINAQGLASESLVFSGVSTLIVTPLEAEGQVIGLLYFDAMPRREPFNEDDLRLVTTLAHVAAAKLQSARLMVEVQKTRALEQEMGFARTIQQRLLPHRTPEGGPFSLHAELRAAKEVGGDLYDYFWTRDRFHFCIGDVSGKGVPAALVMAMTKTLFQANT
ncbi:MAG TPA: FHA domain-containing protein, partial [Holophagaceae bacterium]|nr:FHA domain-containing protein [Holophagaceae bacterium]